MLIRLHRKNASYNRSYGFVYLQPTDSGPVFVGGSPRASIQNVAESPRHSLGLYDSVEELLADAARQK